MTALELILAPLLVVALVWAYRIALKYNPDQDEHISPDANHANSQDGENHLIQDSMIPITNLDDLRFDHTSDLTTGEVEAILALVRSLDTYHEASDREIRFHGIDDVTDSVALHDVLKDAVVAQGGLIDFIQDWMVSKYKNELILIGAKTYSIKELRMDIKKESFNTESPGEDYNEEEESRPASLTSILPTKEFTIHSNGHDLKWYANKSLSQVFKNFVAWTFVENLLAMSERDFEEAFFTPEFFKNKVYWNNGEADVENYVNQSDVKNAEEELKAKNKRIRRETDPDHQARKRIDESLFARSSQSDPVLESLESSDPAQTKTVSNAQNHRISGKFFKGLVKAFPDAVVSDGIIWRGMIPYGDNPLGNLTRDHVYDGLVRDGVPLATLSENQISKGLYAAINILGYYIGDTIYLFNPAGKPIARFEGEDMREGLAAAFLLGLFDHETGC